MIIVADSGSTKTDWRVIESKDNIEQLTGDGLNPNFHTHESVMEILQATFKDFSNTQNVNAIYFYGAGCSTKLKNDIITDALLYFFKNATITVEHDLLGAARAACNKEKGIAAILGTGSNACSYDGNHIIKAFPSGGYSIGDEGGGVNIGRRILKAYVEEYMPDELRKRFDFRYKLGLDDILKHLYAEKYPNRFMASFSHFAYQHKENPFIAKEINREFQQFFQNKVLRFDQSKDWSLNIVGSIGYYYHEFIANVAEENGVKLGNIIEKPIAALSLYHYELGQ